MSSTNIETVRLELTGRLSDEERLDLEAAIEQITGPLKWQSSADNGSILEGPWTREQPVYLHGYSPYMSLSKILAAFRASKGGAR